MMHSAYCQAMELETTNIFAGVHACKQQTEQLHETLLTLLETVHCLDWEVKLSVLCHPDPSGSSEWRSKCEQVPLGSPNATCQSKQQCKCISPHGDFTFYTIIFHHRCSACRSDVNWTRTTHVHRCYKRNRSVDDHLSSPHSMSSGSAGPLHTGIQGGHAGPPNISCKHLETRSVPDIFPVRAAVFLYRCKANSLRCAFVEISVELVTQADICDTVDFSTNLWFDLKAWLQEVFHQWICLNDLVVEGKGHLHEVFY